MSMHSILSTLGNAKLLRCLLLLLFTGYAASKLSAQSSESVALEDLQFFEQHVRPVLVQYCYECHSEKSEKLRGGLLLDSKPGWLAGGDSQEPIIVPGDPEASLLIQSVEHSGGLEMPPNGKLDAQSIQHLITWVKRGAHDPRTNVKVEIKRADESWWSLQPIDHAYVDRPIDDFVAEKLVDAGLDRNPPADARTLIRRMCYDVTGLPPTPEDVVAFAADFEKDSERAVQELADQLLSSKEYGERWGRHWLDVIRFGESNGFERNFIINELWPFRDYVIQSFNDDKPMNQFIVEHLAGDVIGKDQPDIEIGAAFLVCGPYDDVGNQDAVAQANIRAATLDEIITATSSAFLGLTINCARCHHHKFDPVPTEDYYRMQAAFAGVKHGARVLATQDERVAHQQATRPLQDEIKRLESEIAVMEASITERCKVELSKKTYQAPRIDPQRTEEKFEPTQAKSIRFNMHAHDSNPKTAVGSRLVEFEVWTAGDDSRNVGLASEGTVASGARSAVAEDFPDAYGPQLVIDGKFGEQWFIGSPAQLTLVFPAVETIDRIVFSNAKGNGIQDKAQGSTPCEYDLEVSSDGQTWTKLLDSRHREPYSEAHAIERVRAEVVTADEQAKLRELSQAVAAAQRKLRAVEPLKSFWVGTPAEPKEPTRLNIGGDPMKLGDEVTPASLSVLSKSVSAYELPIDAPESERRLALAKWIASDSNPLTARVLANRVWHYHFGIGIVDTPSDFGFLGGTPTHPELLDALAAKLIRYQWRLKPLHREILCSKTYRQSSDSRQDAAGIDSDSRLLWRYPPRRLSAEEIRDTMLFVSGQLDQRMGGPGFRLYKHTQNNVSTYFPLDTHGPDTYRRAVYHQNVRASVVDLLSDFDFPDISQASPRRAVTTSPLQSLTLLNHSFTLDMASALARRGEGEAKQDVASSIDKIYQYALQRSPTDIERNEAMKLAEQFGLPAFCRALFNTNEVLYVD